MPIATAPRPPLLVGRARERQVLASLIAGTRDGPRAVVVTGEAGIGKTTLLEWAAATAPGRTLWVRGSESEAVLPFAAAVDLLVPLRQYFDDLPDARREALETVLALRPGSVANPLAACVAALEVLTAAAAEGPLLVVVDDLQWIDRESRQILRYAGRRLRTRSAGLLLAQRDQPAGRIEVDLPVLRLEGMPLADCRALVAGLPVQVSAPVLDQVVAQTGGNPAAVIETASSTPPQLLAGPARDFPGPRLGPALQRAWSADVEAVPEATRTVLAVLATIGSAPLEDIEPVLTALGASLSDLDPAERAGLLQTRSGTVSLRHPLLPAVIIGYTSPAARRRVVLALAVHAEGDLQSWSRAAALNGPDDAIADGLDEVVPDARRRGGHLAAARVGGHAASLTSDPTRRAARLHGAAADALLGGAAERARAWCDDGLALRPGPAVAADLAHVRGRADTWLGHPARAIDDLVRAADGVLGVDAGRAARLYAEAALPCALVGRVSEMLRVVECAAAAQPHAVQQFPVAVASASALLLAGRTEQARRCAAEAERIAPFTDPLWNGHHVVLLAQVLARLEQPAAARTLLGLVLDAARHAAVPSVLAFALVVRAELDFACGQWAAARADAVESLHRAEELSQPAALGHALVALARVDALRGDPDACHRWADRARAEVGPYGIASLRVAVPAVLGLAALTAGDPGSAVAQLDQAWHAACVQGLGDVAVAPLAADLTEAQIRHGRPAPAADALACLDEAAAGGLAQPAAAAARCRGMLADDLETAQRHFATAQASHAAHPVPFERARTLLCEGEVLRRLRRPALARPVLREAESVFAELGARPWAARAATEVAAAGDRSGAWGRRAGPADVNPAADVHVLSAQELQIARCVAEGRNNAEVAAALFVSRKTVEAHLTRVYRKLGVRSRTELVRLLAPGQTVG